MSELGRAVTRPARWLRSPQVLEQIAINVVANLIAAVVIAAALAMFGVITLPGVRQVLLGILFALLVLLLPIGFIAYGAHLVDKHNGRHESAIMLPTIALAMGSMVVVIFIGRALLT